MKTVVAAGCAAALLAGIAVRAAQDAPPTPKPQKEHEWLQQLVGEWDTEAEIPTEPGKPPQKHKGTESGRMIGGFWAMLENKGEFMGGPFTGILTLGYDPGRKKYVGTWIDSTSHNLWQYEGTLDESGKRLTLDSEGPTPDGTKVRFRETTEIRSRDHKVFTSTMEKDGQWVTVVTINYRRKK